LALSLLSASAARAQEPQAAPVTSLSSGARTASNVLYIEGGGNAILYSINYERFFLENFAVRVGAGYMRLSDNTTNENAQVLLAPVMLEFLGARSGAHCFEIGAGALIAYASQSLADGTGGTDFQDGSQVWFTGTVGYRYAPLNGGFTFKAAFTPILADGNFMPWFGLSAGVIF
jgi:hypothetical protein